jgi:hypothetical protein
METRASWSNYKKERMSMQQKTDSSKYKSCIPYKRVKERRRGYKVLLRMKVQAFLGITYPCLVMKKAKRNPRIIKSPLYGDYT